MRSNSGVARKNLSDISNTHRGIYKSILINFLSSKFHQSRYHFIFKSLWIKIIRFLCCFQKSFMSFNVHKNIFEAHRYFYEYKIIHIIILILINFFFFRFIIWVITLLFQYLRYFLFLMSFVILSQYLILTFNLL